MARHRDVCRPWPREQAEPPIPQRQDKTDELMREKRRSQILEIFFIDWFVGFAGNFSGLKDGFCQRAL